MKFYRIVAIIAMYFSLSACTESGSGDGDKPDSTLKIRLTDSSVKRQNISAVEIEIFKVEARHNGEFTTVYERSEIYDVFVLGSGVIEDLAQVPVKSGLVDQLRIYIASAYVFMEDGTIHELQVPSGAQSGLKVAINPGLSIIPGGVPYEFILDFDLYHSLIPIGSPNNPQTISGFHFQPVIKVANKSYHANIYGQAYSDMCTSLPQDDLPIRMNLVSAFRNGELVASTQTNNEGKFMFVGLEPGEYDVVIEAPLHKAIHAFREVSSVTDARITTRLAGKCVSLAGRVFSVENLDEEGVYVLEGALVQMYDRSGNLLDETLSAYDGAFKFSRRFEEDLSLVVSEELHYDSQLDLSVDELYSPLSVRLESKL